MIDEPSGFTAAAAVPAPLCALNRTATIWKTLSPFWGEEYNVHLPPTFHTLSFHVLDEDSLSRDDVIGKVSITKEVLATKPQGFDGWMSLTEVDPDEEVQGEIHLQISIQNRRLRCHVFEARDLARKDRNGASDPFVRVRYNGKTHESTVVKRSCYPRWNESFEFELDESLCENTLSVEVWDWDLVSKNDFLGKVRTDMPSILYTTGSHEAHSKHTIPSIYYREPRSTQQAHNTFHMLQGATKLSSSNTAYHKRLLGCTSNVVFNRIDIN
ncbi:RASL2 protein, partial [Polyodon spathula]|nr:RASL2 protein [Polyodon spathula]